MKLLPCPFCGGTDIKLSEGSTFRWRYVGCPECGAQLEFRSDTRFEPTDKTWKDAAETWNRRAYADQPEQAVALGKPPCDCVQYISGYAHPDCCCGNTGDVMQTQDWCTRYNMQRNARPALTDEQIREIANKWVVKWRLELDMKLDAAIEQAIHEALRGRG